jgi:hypothetical protein
MFSGNASYRELSLGENFRVGIDVCVLIVLLRGKSADVFLGLDEGKLGFTFVLGKDHCDWFIQ